ncbi:MAG: hypothetical protein ACM30I_06650 [Gemmatimonas sp.]
MKQPAENRSAVANMRLAREIEDLAEAVRRHPELHHDSADRLLALARRLRDGARVTAQKAPTRRAAKPH